MTNIILSIVGFVNILYGAFASKPEYQIIGLLWWIFIIILNQLKDEK